MTDLEIIQSLEKACEIVIDARVKSTGSDIIWKKLNRIHSYLDQQIADTMDAITSEREEERHTNTKQYARRWDDFGADHDPAEEILQ